MTSTITPDTPAEDSAENIRATLRTFKTACGIKSDQQLAELLGDGWTRDRVQQKLSGKSKLDVYELEDFARAFGVRPGILYMEPNRAIEVASKRFGLVIDWRRLGDLGRRLSTWIAESAALRVA